MVLESLTAWGADGTSARWYRRKTLLGVCGMENQEISDSPRASERFVPRGRRISIETAEDCNRPRWLPSALPTDELR